MRANNSPVVPALLVQENVEGERIFL